MSPADKVHDGKKTRPTRPVQRLDRIWFYFLALACCLSGPVHAASSQQWRQALDAIVADIRAIHPQPFAKIGETAFAHHEAELSEIIDGLSDDERAVGIMRLVALLGDGHTQAEPDSESFALWYPVRVFEFSDGYYVTGAHQSVAELAGARILEIDGRPVEQVAVAARALMGADNRYDRRRRLYALHNAALMRGLGFSEADGSLRLRVRGGNGETREQQILPSEGGATNFDWLYRPEYWGAFGPPGEWVSALRGLNGKQLRERDDSRPLHLRYRRARFATALPEQGAYYVQANYEGGIIDDESFYEFFRRTLSEVDTMRPRDFILDLRFNIGGDGSLLVPVMREFIARYDDPPWQNFFMLTGRRTFSAGVMFAAEMIKYMDPILVGEPMGAALNSFGDAMTRSYPDVGMRVSISHVAHQLGSSRDDRSFVPVDFPAPFSFADYAAGRDPAVDPILEGAEMRRLSAIAAAEGADHAFEVYRARRARFDESWRRPGEFTLRQAVQVLENEDRLNEAIEIATFNSLVNSNDWRPWYHLGTLYDALDREEEAIASYRRSLAIDDPTNHNAQALRRRIDEYEARSRGE